MKNDFILFDWAFDLFYRTAAQLIAKFCGPNFVNNYHEACKLNLSSRKVRILPLHTNSRGCFNSFWKNAALSAKTWSIFADDEAVATANFENVELCLLIIVTIGPKCGYLIEMSKNILLLITSLSLNPNCLR